MMQIDAQFHDLEGKSVFITGGGSGIGAALTEGFVSQKAKVAFVQRSDASEFCDRLEEEYGTRPLFIQCDLTDVSKLQAAIGQAVSAHGPIGVLVNNAANDTRHKTEEVTVEEWDANHAVNLRPYFFGIQAVLGGMKQLGGGAIVNFTSVTYLMGLPGMPAYVSANAGIMGLTRALARELGPDNIRINAVAPGWILTERQLRLWASPEALEEFLEKQCLREHLYPEDMVGTVLFLASSASRMMTAQVLAVDGGVVMTG